MQLLFELFAFICALSRRIEVLATGGLAAIVTYGVMNIYGESAPLWVWILIILITFFTSAFLVWRDERIRVATLETELEKNTPRLKGQILHVTAIDDPRGTLVALYVVLKNAGGDSIADRFSVTYRNDSIVKNGELFRIHQDLPLKDGSIIKPADGLIEKTMQDPIVRNSQKVGMLLCKFQASVEELTRAKVQYEVSCYDSTDTKCSFTSAPLAGNQIRKDVPTWIPGFETVVGGSPVLPKKTRRKKK